MSDKNNWNRYSKNNNRSNNDDSIVDPTENDEYIVIEEGNEDDDDDDDNINNCDHRNGNDIESAAHNNCNNNTKNTTIPTLRKANNGGHTLNTDTTGSTNDIPKPEYYHHRIPSSAMSNRREYFAAQQQQQYYPSMNDRFSSCFFNDNNQNTKKNGQYYNWRLYSPGKNGTWIQFIRWIIVGGASNAPPLSSEKYIADLCGLGQCLTLLRQYVEQYGIPPRGGITDQSYVLREITRDLYAGGTPLWALESVMQRATEGLTGDPNVIWCFLPRRAFVYHHSAAPHSRLSSSYYSSNNDLSTSNSNSTTPTTSFFKFERGFAVQRLDSMESVVVRLASFASNTSGAAILPNTHFPTADEFNISAHQSTRMVQERQSNNRITTTTNATNQQTPEDPPQTTIGSTIRSTITSIEPTNTDDEIVFEPIRLEDESKDATTTAGKNERNDNASSNNNTNDSNQDILLSEQKQLAKKILDLASETQGLFYYVNSAGYAETIHNINSKNPLIDRSIWTVSDIERECFSRLACIEAMEAIDEIDTQLTQKPLYPKAIIITFRVVASAGACAIWFSGSWIDMIVAGVLGYIVALIGESSILSKQEKIIIEAVACYVVGLTAGLIALQFPSYTCFTAMAISGIIDLLQGFRVIYAIVEIMSRNTVAGGADFLEGILFTGLIAYFLRFGQYTAGKILLPKMDDNQEQQGFQECSSGISQYWYFLLVPLAALSWSGLFGPNYDQLLPMTFHGILAYSITYVLKQAGANDQLNNFVSATCITFSAGLVSRFTGRQAVGNTVAGLYALVPGAYLVKSFYDDVIDTTFFTQILQTAISIGVGSWTGTLLCSPTLLSTTRGLVNQQHQILNHLQHHGSDEYPRPYRRSESGSSGRNSTTGTGKRRFHGGQQPTMLYF